MTIRNICRVFLLLIIIILTLVLLFTWFKGYQDSIETILNTIGTNKKIDDLTSVVPEQRFRYLQFLLAAKIIFLSILFGAFNRVYNILSVYLISLLRFTSSLAITTLRSENKYIMLIPVLGIFYYAITMPICYDEGLTYLFFTSKSFLSSISFYPEPNNHILHSLLTNITIHLPFGDTEFRLRFPSLIVSVLTWMLSYHLLLKYYNKQVAMIVTSVASMMFMVFYYSYQSRGYALLNLFFISALYNALGIIRKNDSLENWVWFGVSSILGFYTIPSFLYPFLTLNLIILIYNLPNIKRQVITNLTVAVSTIILYLPIIIVNGLQALTGNKWVKSIDRGEVLDKLPDFFKSTLNELSQFPWWFVLILLLPSLVYAVISRQKFLAGIFIIFLLSPFTFLLAQSVIPFPRTFAYYGFILPFLAIAGFSTCAEKIPVKALTFILMVMQLGLLYQFSRKIYPYEERDPQLNMTSKKLTNMMVGNKRYFSSGNLLGTILLYELKTQGFNRSEVIFSNGPINADTLNGFDYIIIGLDEDQTIRKKPAISTTYYHIYQDHPLP